jgi:hypothetical protein
MKQQAGRRGSTQPNNGGTAFLGTLAAFAVVVLMLLVVFTGLVGRASAYSAQANLEPTPGLAGNVTVSTHLYGADPLSYVDSNGATQTLVAHVDTVHVANPYSINPSGVVAPGVLQSTRVAGGLWNNTSLWNSMSVAAGQHQTGPTLVTVNGLSAVQWTINATHAAAEDSVTDLKTNIVQALWPSTNPTFDYWTEIWEISSSATCASCAAYASFANASGNGLGEKIAWSTATGGIEPIGSAGGLVNVIPAVGSNSILYFSASQAQLSSSANLGLNATGAGSTASLNPTIWIHTPLTATATTITLNLVGMAYGTAPLTFGKTYWAGTLNANMTRQASAGNLNLSSIASSFTYTSITGGSFTVAIRQGANDVGLASISQTANGNGTETITYVFNFGLPIAPSLSYLTFKVADVPRLAAWQYAAVSFGGAAYTSVYQVKASIGNYTTLVASVVPTTAAAWVGTVTYTAAQWDLISAPPAFFSENGIQFYWFELIGAILLFTGLGASAWATRNQRALRIRRGGMSRVPGLALFLWLNNRRSLRQDQRGLLVRTHHWIAIIFGSLLLLGGAAGAWAFSSGGTIIDSFGTFIAAIIVFGVIFAVAFVIYEAAEFSKKRGHKL